MTTLVGHFESGEHDDGVSEAQLPIVASFKGGRIVRPPNYVSMESRVVVMKPSSPVD